jgi:hypothetical protein
MGRIRPYLIHEAERSDAYIWHKEKKNNKDNISHRQNRQNRHNKILVHLAPSTLCDGKGLFASCFLPKGSIVTAYAGRVSHKYYETRFISQLDSAYVYEMDSRTRIDGLQASVKPNWWSSHGLAQMTNDAVHVDVTGFKNNCNFVDVDVPLNKSKSSILARRCRSQIAKSYVQRVYLKTSCDIKEGEELLVPYQIYYWIGIYNNDHTKLPNKLQRWLQTHIRIKKVLEKVCNLKLDIDEFIDFKIEDDVGKCAKASYNVTIKSKQCSFYPKKQYWDVYFSKHDHNSCEMWVKCRKTNKVLNYNSCVRVF